MRNASSSRSGSHRRFENTVRHGVLEIVLANDPVVLRVWTNPEPQRAVRCGHADRAIVQPDTHRPEPSDLLEMQRWMPSIGLQQRVILVCQLPDFLGKFRVQRPEFWRGVMVQSCLNSPRLNDSRAASASLSSLPLSASRSMRSSHTYAWYASNHAVNVASSAGESSTTACSRSLTLMFFSLVQARVEGNASFLIGNTVPDANREMRLGRCSCATNKKPGLEAPASR